jgi:hypothetical protein
MRRTIRRSERLGVRSRTGAAPRRATLAAVALAVLAACFLPQPLPDYPPGTITPPRILVDGIEANESAVRLVPAGCATDPEYPLSAQIYDTTGLHVEARWFVNYHAEYQFVQVKDDPVPPHPDPLVLTRTVPVFAFRPYTYPPPVGAPTYGGLPYKAEAIVRVVELVVATNGFDPAADSPPAPLPRRTPLAGNETQLYRWVFLSVPSSDEVPCFF